MDEVRDISSLTPEMLRGLYVDQGMAESAIASMYGTHQVKIGRLRKKWGIPTITKGDRLSLSLPSSLTREQEDVLVGSLLGDGWMDATSDQSARFQEQHAMPQSEYLRWKGHVLSPFVSGLTPVVWKKGEISHHGVRVSTPSCPVLRPFYDLFYPPPERVRVFPRDLPSRMTPLVLAVWYMDDGGVTPRGEPRIAFGLDDTSRKRALKALRSIGLIPKVYGVGGDQAIHFPKQSMAFRALVAPHVHPSLMYKLPTESSGQALHRKVREKADPDRVAALYRNGLSVEEIASLVRVGASTVKRRLESAGVEMRRPGPRPKPSNAAEAVLALGRFDSSKWGRLPLPEQDDWVQRAFSLIRGHGFPFPSPLTPDEVQKEFDGVREAKLKSDDLPSHRAGLRLCTSLFPNRYHATSRRGTSAWGSWHNDADLMQAIRFQFKVGDPVLPHRVLRAITMQCRTPSIFRPTVARAIYERFCLPGGRVWDPCSGYGGRLMGALAAGVHYIGTDVDPDTVTGNRNLASILGRGAEVHLSPAEIFDPGEVDLVFTSPPYFNREHYSLEGGQSWLRYPEMGKWVEGFLRPVIRMAHLRVRASGHLIVNIADIRDGRRTYPLVGEVERVAREEGFQQLPSLRMPLSSLNRKDALEPVLVFRR